jgi:hypothetical protein
LFSYSLTPPPPPPPPPLRRQIFPQLETKAQKKNQKTQTLKEQKTTKLKNAKVENEAR